MDIKDCKIGTRVVCINDGGGNIPTGTLGTIIEDDQTCPFVAWDEYFNDNQFDRDGYKNICGMYLREIEVLKENPSEEDSSKGTNLGKLTVSLATEDTNKITKDILKVVLQDLYNYIENLSKGLDEGSKDEVKESLVTEQDVLDNLLYCINSAVDKNDEDAALKLSEAYQRIKSISVNTTRSI